MIRFVANGIQGRVLGIGLSSGNLDELRREHPIVFDLAPYGSSGRLVIACGDERTVEQAMLAFPDGHVITLAPRTLDTLRAGEAMTIPFDELGVPGLFAGVLFAGETEHELIASLRAIELLDSATTLEGLEEYDRHEHDEVEDCPLCRERRPGRPTPWRERLSHSPNLPYLIVLAGLAVCALLSLVISLAMGEPEPVQNTKPPPPPAMAATSERTRAWIASDQARRQSLNEGAPGVLTLVTDKGAHAPCTAPLTVPQPLGRRLIGSGPPVRSDVERFESAMEIPVLVLYDMLDVMPGIPEGVGPVRRRLNNDTLADNGSLSSPYRLTFVVDAWTDPVFSQDPSSNTYTPGAVTGRLVVWSLDERAFVCASPPVTATTPPLTLVRQDSGELSDDPLLKARVETLLAGVSAAAPRLEALAATGH